MLKLWTSIIICSLAGNMYAQLDISKLSASGFENIIFAEEEDTIRIFFEHREFRNPGHSIQYAELLMTDRTRDKNFLWIPLLHNVPIYVYDTQNLKSRLLSFAEKEFFQKNNKPFRNYRFNFRLHPQFSARFGYFTDPFETKLNFILGARIYLARGLSMQSGITIPVHNNLDNHGKKLRAAPTMLHYFAQPWNSHFVSLSAGTFYNDRYGLDLEYRFAQLDSNWSFGLAGGLTGYYRLYGLEYYSESMDDIYAIADVEWRTGIENTTLKLSAGQFLYMDRGARIDLIKQYPAAELGLFASHTDIGNTVGFQFAFSLWPGKILRNDKFELRTSESFRWAYSYNGFDPVAKQVRRGTPRLANVLRNYNEKWVKAVLTR
ncbi:YjbH domain-containing protein [Christiangramia aquimixticola]|uniref:YjbH domain-containing protein n=1 Tax=Christiangramia aquimixticola TaxID=1697558 RepID=UPI003AA89B21